MSEHRELVNDVIRKISAGEIALDKAWSTIRNLKDKYTETCERLHPEKDAEQSWHERRQRMQYQIKRCSHDQ